MYYVFTQFLYPHPSPINPAVGDFFIDSAKTIPIYFCPGNHDYYTTLYPPGSLTQANNLPNYVQSVAPDTDYAIISSYYVILMVRSGYDIPYWDELDMFTPDGSGITDAQCSWIRSQLKENSTKRKIIVMHHPVTNIDGTNCDGTAFTTTIPEVSSGSIANNRQTLLNICDSNNVDIMLTGHQHQNVVTDLNGNIVAENCTTCGTRYVQTGAAFNGCYRVITVTPTFVTVSIPLESCVATSVREKYAYSIDVYPNPAIDDILVDTYVKSSIEIYNTNGQLIYNTYSDGTPFNVDVSRYPKGIYLIKVVGETGMIVKSFAKE
jgi:3',5'-cyclic AMP phosphodiesterase CpdA